MSTPETEVMDAELVPYEPAPATLFRTSDPAVALARMAEAASALVGVVDDRKLYATINGKRHLLVTAWTTLGAMLGVYPVVMWTRPNETNDGYIARVEARTREGALVGAAESECSRTESAWRTRDPYALRSMAQTRAISRALRGPLEQVVVLAGYEASSADEMPASTEPAAEPLPAVPIPVEVQPSDEELQELLDVVERLTEAQPDTDWRARVRSLMGGTKHAMWTRSMVQGATMALRDEEAAS